MLNLGFPELIIIILTFSFFVFTIFALIRCLTNDRIENTMKVVWVVLIFLFPLFGSFAYFIFNPKKRAS